MKGKWMKRALSIMLISVFAVTLCVGIGLKTVKAEETADTLATLFSETNTYSTASDRITLRDTSNAL